MPGSLPGTSDPPGRLSGVDHPSDAVVRRLHPLLVEVRDAVTALAFSVAPEVVAIVDFGGSTITWSTEPSRRADDAPAPA